jgi:hypothetical protein
MTPHSKIEQITNSPDFGIVAYGRLSREEADDRATPMEEKIALRKQILLTLAKHYHLTLTDEQNAPSCWTSWNAAAGAKSRPSSSSRSNA